MDSDGDDRKWKVDGDGGNGAPVDGEAVFRLHCNTRDRFVSTKASQGDEETETKKRFEKELLQVARTTALGFVDPAAGVKEERGDEVDSGDERSY